MLYVYPDYYKEFKCIAGDCRHSCCIGWEIDIDPDTAEFYRTVDGDFGEKLKRCISEEEPPHFILTEGERCPFLNEQNLCDVILVNDCSEKITTDFLRAFVQENSKHFRLLENDENLGFPRTCNKGMKASNSDILVLLNSDTMIPASFCEKLLPVFHKMTKLVLQAH